jgi:hypothetical protein
VAKLGWIIPSAEVVGGLQLVADLQPVAVARLNRAAAR